MEPIKRRCSTGLSSLDEFLLGGLGRKTCLWISGPEGKLRTTLAVQLVEQLVSKGFKILYATSWLKFSVLASSWLSNGHELFKPMDISDSGSFGVVADSLESMDFVILDGTSYGFELPAFIYFRMPEKVYKLCKHAGVAHLMSTAKALSIPLILFSDDLEFFSQRSAWEKPARDD